MDEDKLWKGFYNKLQQLKTDSPSEHEQILRVADGGFFEKFGSVLESLSFSDNNQSKSQLASFSENGNSVESPIHPENESSTFESIRSEIDSEKKEQILEEALGMNMEDLYEEILFEICNNIGCEANSICAETLFQFVQEVFRIPDTQHHELLELVQRKDPPRIRLNVEAIKAENLVPKDSNGLSDPFVTLYLESNASHRYNSSVKTATLDPIWEEHFSLPIAESPNHEILIIEVWDFDAAETVKEKVNKLFDVKGIKGLRKLMKEIALTASTGKHDNELIGRTSISLKSVPVSGISTWHSLEKGTKSRNRGSILVNLSLSAEKNKNVGTQEHKHLLKLLLMHELENSQVAPFWWNGKFSSNAEIIRSQHAVQSGLSSFECALCQWSVYTAIHEDHPLSFTLFNSILNVTVPFVSCYQENHEHLKVISEGAKRLLPSCFLVIRKLRSKNASEAQIVKTLCEVLDIISKLKSLNLERNNNLFSKTTFKWLSPGNNENNDAICLDTALVMAIESGTKEWLSNILEGNKLTSKEISNEETLQYLIKVIQMARSDLQKAIDYYDEHFSRKLQLGYSSIIYKVYDVKMVEIFKPIVMDISANIKRLNVPENQGDFSPSSDDMNMGTTLFELYMVLKRFLALGKSICSNEELALDSFYQWFVPGVAHWLDISIIKALKRIEKAIELDQLRPVDETVKYSSSAVDTLSIFYQIKIFWNQLDWPDVEGSYTFIAKIVDDICRCCIFYAQKMSYRMENLVANEENIFCVSTEWCLAINNIDYIRQSLTSFMKELGTDAVIKKLEEHCSSMEAKRCETTLITVIDNALDIEKNQIFEIIEIVARKMSPTLKHFLTEGAAVLHDDSNSLEKLMTYLENSLGCLYEALNEVNFARILDAIWMELSLILYDLIQVNLEKRRPPAFFQNLKRTLNVMVSCFKTGHDASPDVKILAEIEKTLDLHALETTDLIYQYYVEQLECQKKLTKSEWGQLTITARFSESSVELCVLNARNLFSGDGNKSCDPFVRIYVLPTHKFPGVAPMKTAVQNKTRFPLYDERFVINLNEEQMSEKVGILRFIIKDKDLFGLSNQYIGECYISFEEIDSQADEQINLNLVKPSQSDSEIIRALECRQGDRQARDFLKKLKNF